MTHELVEPGTGEVTDVIVAPSWSPEQMQLIKDTVAKGATDDEFKLFLYVCRKRRLDPLARQIYFIKRGNTGTIQTGIDGFRLIADRNGGYAGQDAPVFQYSAEGERVVSATVTVYRIIANGDRVGFTATAFYVEYVQTIKEGGPNSMWRKMPHSQLAKCAEALALRKAFPDDLSGIYTDDEMGQADNKPLPSSRQVTQKPAAKPKPIGIAKLMGMSKEQLVEQALKGLSTCFPADDTAEADAFLNKHLEAKTIQSITLPENTKGELAQFVKALIVLSKSQEDATPEAAEFDMDDQPEDVTAEELIAAVSDRDPDRRTMLSKFGDPGKPSLCNHCGEYHVLKGHAICTNDEGKWGHIACWLKK